MGDRRHKKPPLSSAEEVDVTPEFRERAKKRIADNEGLNKISGAKEGEPGYLIDSQAALARWLTKRLGRTIGEKHVSNIIGPVRPGSKWDRVDRSTYVHPISEALRFESTTMIPVPVSRVPLFSWLAQLPDVNFEEFRVALEAARAKARR